MRLFGRGSARSAGVALVVTCWAVCVVLAGGEVAVEVAVEVAGKEHMEVKMSDGASQWVPVPASIREGKIGGEGASTGGESGLGILAGLFVQCWAWSGSRPRVWDQCCTNRSGYSPPRGRRWCWPLDAPKDHWGNRLWTFETCCEHRGQDWTVDLASFYEAKLAFPMAGKNCPHPFGFVCDLAIVRTRLARWTRQRAHALCSGSGLPSAAALSRLRSAVPALGFPVSHDPGGKYAMRLLRSIDFPVERLIVVLNVQELAEPPWIKEAKELHPSLEVVKPKVNLGCAGGWNSVIESVPSAPYWFILNNDLEFPPGTLRQIAELVADDLAVGNHSADGSLPVFMRSFGLRGGTDRRRSGPV
mmetsp:Transcript_170606/g.541950  ORF Transcript_170606/g.541950 Transcript_170606/m.541950 type:complete len:359 (+) Transcript_170606:113-1189(+)